VKLAKVVVASSSCLVAFSAKDSNTYFCFLDHIDIVASVPDCQGDSFDVLFDECDNFCLLIGC
jgi:hypothetical protein